MFDLPLRAGGLAYWLHQASDAVYGWRPVVKVLVVHPRTAHIEVQRRNGTTKRRWVKLRSLIACRG